MTTLTHTEAVTAREAAWHRFQAARTDHDAWARAIAGYVVRGGDWSRSAEVSGDNLIIARAAEFEACADWHEARERVA